MSEESLSSKDELREQAVQWFLNRAMSSLTPSEERNFQEWISTSDAHRGMFETVQAAWSVAGMAKDDPILEKSRPQLEIVSTILPEAPGSSVNDTGDGKPPAKSKWKIAVFAATLLAVSISPSIISQYFRASPSQALQAFQTEIGQRATITLPDGTVVKLDSETEINFRALSNERQLELARGRAYFEVAKDPSKPFSVHANGQVIRAIGTAFEVKIDDKIVAVVLAEGKVRVEEAGNPKLGTEMTPGRQLTINPNRKWVLNDVDVKKETGWTEGRLIFLHDPLSEAIAEVNRYSTRKLTFKDENIPDKVIVGSFPAGDVQSFIRALELNGIAKHLATTPDEFIMTGEVDEDAKSN